MAFTSWPNDAKALPCSFVIDLLVRVLNQPEVSFVRLGRKTVNYSFHGMKKKLSIPWFDFSKHDMESLSTVCRNFLAGNRGEQGPRQKAEMVKLNSNSEAFHIFRNQTPHRQNDAVPTRNGTELREEDLTSTPNTSRKNNPQEVIINFQIKKDEFSATTGLRLQPCLPMSPETYSNNLSQEQNFSGTHTPRGSFVSITDDPNPRLTDPMVLPGIRLADSCPIISTVDPILYMDPRADLHKLEKDINSGTSEPMEADDGSTCAHSVADAVGDKANVESAIVAPITNSSITNVDTNIVANLEILPCGRKMPLAETITRFTKFPFARTRISQDFHSDIPVGVFMHLYKKFSEFDEKKSKMKAPTCTSEELFSGKLHDHYLGCKKKKNLKEEDFMMLINWEVRMGSSGRVWPKLLEFMEKGPYVVQVLKCLITVLNNAHHYVTANSFSLFLLEITGEDRFRPYKYEGSVEKLQSKITINNPIGIPIPKLFDL